MKNVFITGGAGYIGSYFIISLVKTIRIKFYKIIFSNSHKSIIKKLEKIANKKIFF